MEPEDYDAMWEKHFESVNYKDVNRAIVVSSSSSSGSGGGSGSVNGSVNVSGSGNTLSQDNARALKKEQKSEIIKTTLGDLYPKFTALCEINTIVHRKHMLVFYIVQIINERHIFRKWNRTFEKNKCFIAERFKNAQELIFHDYTLVEGELKMTVFKLWENYKVADFKTKLETLEKVYTNITKLLDQDGIGKRLFTREVEIIDWYDNICEFYSHHTCSTLTNVNELISPHPCAIKLMMKYNNSLHTYDVNRLVSAILRYRTNKKIVLYVNAIYNSPNVTVCVNLYEGHMNKLLKTSYDLIMNSNAGIENICTEMMKCSALCIKRCINIIDDLCGYKIKKEVFERNDFITNSHKEILLNLILAKIYLSLILLCAYNDKENKTEAVKLVVKLSRSLSILYLRDLKVFCHLFTRYISLSKKSVKDRSRHVPMEKAIAGSVHVLIAIFQIYFGAKPRPTMSAAAIKFKNINITRNLVMKVIDAKNKSKTGTGFKKEDFKKKAQ